MPSSRSLWGFLRAVLWEDWSLKFVCLVLATLSWFYIDGELTDRRSFTLAPHSIRVALPPGMEVSAQGFPRLEVELFGPRRRLQYLSSENLSVELKDVLVNPVPGINRVKVRPGDVLIQGLDGVEVVAVKEPEFDLELIRISRKALKVKVRRQGECRRGFRVVDMECHPDTVNVTSTHDLAQAEYIWTQPVDVADRAEDFQQEIGVEAMVQSGERDVSVLSAQKVTVSLKIRPDEKIRVIDEVKVAAWTPPGTVLWIDPESVRVMVKGAPEDVDLLRGSDIPLYVEWPSDWSSTGPANEILEPRRVQVRMLPLPKIQVRGENNQPLPTVQIGGRRVGSAHP